MFDPTFLDQLTDIIADKVIRRLEERFAERGELTEWFDRYGLTMTREEVAEALKVSKRTVINLEDRGELDRVSFDGKKVRYSTAKIYNIANQNQP